MMGQGGSMTKAQQGTTKSVARRKAGARLAPRRHSLRLPVAVEARLAAWCEMHPEKTRSEHVAALLATALAEAERTLPKVKGGIVDRRADTQRPVYLLTGPFAEFRGLVNKHHLRIEHELNHEAPEAPYPAEEYLLDEE